MTKPVGVVSAIALAALCAGGLAGLAAGGWPGLASGEALDGSQGTPGRRGGRGAAANLPTWAALYGGRGGEEMEGVAYTSDGGFIVAGSTDSYRDENGEAWLLKLDCCGNVEWQRTYGGPNDEYAIDVKQTTDGGYIVAGWTKSFGAGRTDFWVFKLDPLGNIEWERTYGGAGKEQAWSVDQTADGGYIVAGGTTSFGAGRADYWVLKLDRDGDIEWQRTYGGRRDDGGGGEYDELVVRVLEDRDGNYVVASETASFGAGETDIWVLKLDRDGDVLWQRAYGGRYEDSLWTFQEAADGGYILPGVSVSFSPDLSGDLWVLKIDRDGRILWQRIYGVPDYWDEALTVGATSDGGALVGGYYEERRRDWDLLLLRLSATGEAQWQRIYEYGWDWANAIQQVADGGYVVVGVAWPRPGPLDLWVLRLDAGGTIGPACDFIHDIELTQVDTDATPITTNAVVKDTRVRPRDSSAVVEDSPTVPEFLCRGELAGDCSGADCECERIGPDLVSVPEGAFAVGPKSSRRGRRVEARLAVANQGNERSGRFRVRTYLSDDATLDAADALKRTHVVRRLRPGRVKNLTVRVRDAASMSGKYLIAVIDADGEVAESNENNNRVVGRIP